MKEYPNISEATKDVRTKINTSSLVNHPFTSPVLSAVVPTWTEVLTGFEAGSMVTTYEKKNIEQIRNLYEAQEGWLTEASNDFDIQPLNEHDPAAVLFMGLFRDLQLRFGPKQNLNPHKLAVLLDERYEIDE